MFVKYVLATASALSATVLLVPAAKADTLAVQPAQKHRHRSARYAEHGNVPSRGMSMAQVERRYGTPLEKLAAAGGDTPRHPVIHRWRYNGYTVYFERSHVIHSVLDAGASAPRS
jgi:hypothetical protein